MTQKQAESNILDELAEHTESVTATSPESSKAEPADKELSKQSAITEDLNDTIPVEVVKQATNEVKSSKDGGF